MKNPELEGHVITMNSFMAQRDVPPVKSMHFYVASKHALNAITQGFRNELKELGSRIRVSQISPQLVNTPLAIQTVGEANYERMVSSLMEPSDIADAVMYILSTPANVQVNDIMLNNMPPSKKEAQK